METQMYMHALQGIDLKDKQTDHKPTKTKAWETK